MGTLDRALERIYARLGSRIIPACQAVTFSYGLIFGYTYVLAFVRMKEAPAAKALQLCAIWGGEFILAALVAGFAVLRAARPLTTWLDGPRTARGAEEAWRTALRLPVITARCYSATTLAFAPIDAWLTSLVEPDRLTTEISYTAGYLVGVGPIIAGCMFTAQLAARPVIRDVARYLENHPPTPPGASVRLRLLAIAPALLIPPLFWGSAVTVQPGAATSQPLGGLVIGAAIVAALGVPLVLLLAHSTLQPLNDLLRVAEGLKTGDMTMRVPELSADEHGRLAHAFNEAIAGLAERERLAAENTSLLTEVQASRARILEASDAERRRVERNIHDGAQQRLVGTALKLQLLEEEAAGGAGSERVRELARQASRGLHDALDDLRDLARGLHPTVLETDGLQPALEQLAARAPVPVALDLSVERYAPTIESTIYFLASEALANVAKYSEATRAEISVQRRNGSLVVCVADDGVGGARPDRGSGLTGLADRVAALGGAFSIDSPDGAGTTLTATVPL